MRTLGFVLATIGLVMLLIRGINVVTKKKVLNVGPVEVNKEVSHPVQWSPIVGGVLLVGGIILVAVSRKERPAGPAGPAQG